jgi:hypothetical protein
MSAQPGQVIPIAVVFDHRQPWHTLAGAHAPDGLSPKAPLRPITIRAIVDDARLLARTDALQWPQVTVLQTEALGARTGLPAFQGRAIAYLPLEVRPDAAAGNTEVRLLVSYQACDERISLAPVEGQRLDLTLAITPPTTLAPAVGPGAGQQSASSVSELFTEYRPVDAALARNAYGLATGSIKVSPRSLSVITIMTAALVGAGVIGVVVIAVLRRRDAAAAR